MNDTMLIAFSLLAGVQLGAVFFCGLWWTVQKGVASPKPALWFGISLLLRTSIVTGGFYSISGGDWKRLLGCMAGFIIARAVITRLTANRMTGEVRHAP